MEDIKVYPCGTVVIPNMLGMECTIEEVSIKFDSTSYQCYYFLNGEVKAIWQKEQQFKVKDGTQKSSIGFTKT